MLYLFGHKKYDAIALHSTKCNAEMQRSWRISSALLRRSCLGRCCWLWIDICCILDWFLRAVDVGCVERVFKHFYSFTCWGLHFVVFSSLREIVIHTSKSLWCAFSVVMLSTNGTSFRLLHRRGRLSSWFFSCKIASCVWTSCFSPAQVFVRLCHAATCA